MATQREMDGMRRRRARMELRLRHVARDAKNVPCADCEREFPHYVLEFDHARGEKVAGITEIIGRRWSVARLLEELTKCDVVCANCHKTRTHNRAVAAGQRPYAGLDSLPPVVPLSA